MNALLPYYTTQLEDYIINLYQHLGIFVPEDIDMLKIAKKLNIWIHYAPIGSHSIERNSLASIVIDERKTQQEQFEDFAHEVAHLLLHVGNQLNMPQMFLEYQEWKADNFALHFCMPTFMIQKLKLPVTLIEATYFLSNIFNVTLEFARRRLVHYYNQLRASQLQAVLQANSI